MSHPLCATLPLAIVLLSVRPVLAQGSDQPLLMPARARLQLPTCEALPFDRRALTDILQVELSGYGVELTSGGPAHVGSESDADAILTIDVSECEQAATAVDLVIEHSPARQSRHQLLEITEANPVVQARIIALALSELLRGVWRELATAALGSGELASPAPPAAPADDAPGPAPSPASSPSVEQANAREPGADGDAETRRSPTFGPALDVSIETRSYTSYGGAQIGGVVAASLPLGALPLQLAVDLGGWYGIAFDPLGSVDLVSTLAGLTLSWLARWPSWNVGIGPRIELGWARLVGRPSNRETTWSATVDAFVTSLTLCARLRFRVHRRVLLLVTGQVGYVLLGIEAVVADRAAAGIGGPIIELGLGIAIEPLRQP